MKNTVVSAFIFCIALAWSPAQADPWGSETITVFDGVLPSAAGVQIDSGVAYTGFGHIELGSHDENGLSTFCFNQYPDGVLVCGVMAVMADNVIDNSWARIRSFEHNAGCTEANDTDIGGGWCRRSFDENSAPFDYLPDFTPTCDGPYGCYGPALTNGRFDPDIAFAADNLVIELIRNNIDVDLNPWSTSNIIRPNDEYFITVQIMSTSVADGDTHDFDSATVDPASLRLGPGQAQVASAVLTADYDNDGDTDHIFGFRMQDTGFDCLTSTISIAGTTYSGDPIAGTDNVTAVDCSLEVEMDVDAFNEPNIIRPDDNYNVSIVVMGQRISAGDATNLFPGLGLYSSNSLAPDSLRFGPAEAPPAGEPIYSDFDGDSYQDMLVNVNVFDMGIACGDTELQMIGEKADGNGNPAGGYPIMAVDAIVTEDCDAGSCHP